MTASPLANPTATRQLLERFGLATKHRLGQNFLVDDHVIQKILDLARLDGSASCVLEVGPGIGTLTLGMLPHAAGVVAIEADHTLEPVLEDLAHAWPSFAFVMGDALRVEQDQVCRAAATAGMDGEPNILVANLPYNVAATIILKYLSENPALQAAVVMVQKEVADRICAQPATKAYGGYTAKLTLYAEATGRFEVPPTCFMPAPHVDSAVVRLDRTQTQATDGHTLNAAELSETCRVIDAAFAQRRKTIRNSMSASGFDKARLDEAFASTGVAPTARAETLAPADFVRLAAQLAD